LSENSSFLICFFRVLFVILQSQTLFVPIPTASVWQRTEGALHNELRR